MSALPALPNMLDNIARGTCRALGGRRRLGSFLPSPKTHVLIALARSFNQGRDFLLGLEHSDTAHVRLLPFTNKPADSVDYQPLPVKLSPPGSGSV